MTDNAAPQTPFQDIEARGGKAAATPLAGVMDLPPPPSVSERPNDDERQATTRHSRMIKPILDTTPRTMERVVGAISGMAVVTSLVAMIIIVEHHTNDNSVLVIVAGILSSLVGPYAYFQQTQLTEIKALKETQSAVQTEVNRLKNENNRLEVSISQMGESVERLKDIQMALDTITANATPPQRQTIQEFANQVEKNRETLKIMQTNVKNVVVQNLISILERIVDDDDTDITNGGQQTIIESHEIEEALDQLQKLEGVKVDEQKFRKAFRGNAAKSIVGLVENIRREDLPPEDRIFVFHPEQ